MFLAPPGFKDIGYHSHISEEFYIQKAFKKVKVGVAPERMIQAQHNTHACYLQTICGLKHFVSRTMYSLMGDMFHSVATADISKRNSNFKMWEKGQLVVLLSRISRCAKDTIFVGSKADMLDAVKHLLLQNTQWTGYIEDILSNITVGDITKMEDNIHRFEGPRRMDQRYFPYYCIYDTYFPQCNSGFVHMLASLKRYAFIYIGEIFKMIRRLHEHDKGRKSSFTLPGKCRPSFYFSWFLVFLWFWK
jgi:hypothetical protein